MIKVDAITKEAENKFKEIQSSYEKEIEDLLIRREKQEQAQKFQLEQERLERLEKIKEDAKKTTIWLAELEMKLGCFSQLEDSEELHEALKNYKSEFDSLLNQKEAFISMIKDDLQTYEEKYVAAINAFHDEFENLVLRGKDHFQRSREQASIKLKDVEDRLLNERKTIIKHNKDELKSFFKNHEKAEAGFVQHKESEESRCFKELTTLRQEKNREYSDLKLLLETEIQNHEKCLEDMKAIYQLNAEKLNYNFKVLTEKKEENTALAMVLKKKERFFLNLLKKKNDDFYLKDDEFRKINNKLTEHYKNITKKYRELHRKFEHFEKADIERYKQVWQMSLKEINELKRQIVNCHKMLVNQQLGLTFDEKFEDWDENSESKLAPEGKENVAVSSNKYIDESNKSSHNSVLNIKNSVKFTDREMKGSHYTYAPNFAAEEGIQKFQLHFSNEEKNKLINLVLRETEFLLDDKIISEIDAYHDEKEKLLRRMDLLVKVLNLKSLAEVEEWLFKLHINCLNFEDQDYDTDMIIMNISKILDMHKRGSEDEPQDHHFDAKDDSITDKSHKKTELKERAYWKNVGSVLDEQTLEVWDLLDKFSIKYYLVLKERQNIIIENREIKKKNEELRRLLEKHMQEDTQLIYPPKLTL